MYENKKSKCKKEEENVKICTLNISKNVLEKARLAKTNYKRMIGNSDKILNDKTNERVQRAIYVYTNQPTTHKTKSPINKNPINKEAAKTIIKQSNVYIGKKFVKSM
ncbi:hypothetical protein A3Q56_08559, partial [Intoshia linei]